MIATRELNGPTDPHAISQIVGSCPPLVDHGVYAYWMMIKCFPAHLSIAEDAGQAVGFALALPSQEPAGGMFLWQIGVVPEYRRRGVASLLLGSLLDRLGTISRITAAVSADNHAVLALLSSFAFDGTLSPLPLEPADTIVLSKYREGLVSFEPKRR